MKILMFIFVLSFPYQAFSGDVVAPCSSSDRQHLQGGEVLALENWDSESEAKRALAILKRECARKNNCTAQQELEAVEKVLFGVATTVSGGDKGFLAYLKEKISVGLRVLTGSYDVESDEFYGAGQDTSAPIQPVSSGGAH